MALAEPHMKPRCTICIVLTLVAMLSGSYIQCLHMDVEKKRENCSLWDFLRDLMTVMQSFQSLHCMHHYKKNIRHFTITLGFGIFRWSRDSFFRWSRDFSHQ